MPENIRDIQGKLPTPAQGRKMPSANDLVDIARTAAEQAGAYLRSVVTPPDPTAWNAKGRADWATEVDRNSEAIIAESLHGAMPGTADRGRGIDPRNRHRRAWSGSWIRWMAPPTSCTTSRRSPCRSPPRWMECSRLASCSTFHSIGYLSDPRRWSMGEREPAVGLPNHRPRPRPDRHRSAVQGLLPLRRVPGPAGKNHPRRDGREAARISFARPDRRSRWSLRRLLGAAPGPVGCRGGDSTGA